MQRVDRIENRMLFPIQRSSGVSPSTALKFATVGSSGMTVGGQASISCGVLKALETRKTSGRIISRQVAVSTTSIMTLAKRSFVRMEMPRLDVLSGSGFIGRLSPVEV